MSHLDLPDIGAVGERRRPDSECFGTMGDVPRPRGILKKGRFSQDGPAVGSEGGGDDSTDTGNGRDSLSPPSSGAVEQRPAGVHGALLERNLAGADVSKGGSDDGASCPRYFGSQAVRESIAGHVGSVSKTSQEVLELRRQFTGLAAAYDDDTGSDSGSDAAKESLEEGRVHRGEQGALAMLSPVHPKMQDALGEKKNRPDDEDEPSTRPPPPPPLTAAAGAVSSSRRSDAGSRGSSARGLSRFSRDLDLDAMDAKEFAEAVNNASSREAGGGREPSPLPTPEVSKHGTNEAWLFIKDQQRETGAGAPPLRLMNSGLSERSSGNVGAESDGGSTSGPSNSRGGSGRRSGSMHRSASVVSFRGDDGSEGSLHDVHCIGSVNELKKEKKGKRSSTFKWLKKEASALAYEYGLKKKQGTCLDVDKKLKESRRNMVDNLDDTSVHNAGRRAWETRDVSLRGGGEFFQTSAAMSATMRRSASTPKLHGMEGVGDTDEDRGSPMSLPDGLERFTRED